MLTSLNIFHTEYNDPEIPRESEATSGTVLYAWERESELSINELREKHQATKFPLIKGIMDFNETFTSKNQTSDEERKWFSIEHSSSELTFIQEIEDKLFISGEFVDSTSASSSSMTSLSKDFMSRLIQSFDVWIELEKFASIPVFQETLTQTLLRLSASNSMPGLNYAPVDRVTFLEIRNTAVRLSQKLGVDDFAVFYKNQLITTTLNLLSVEHLVDADCLSKPSAVYENIKFTGSAARGKLLIKKCFSEEFGFWFFCGDNQKSFNLDPSNFLWPSDLDLQRIKDKLDLHESKAPRNEKLKFVYKNLVNRAVRTNKLEKMGHLNSDGYLTISGEDNQWSAVKRSLERVSYLEFKNVKNLNDALKEISKFEEGVLGSVFTT
jgi:hypothetical protein